MKISISTGLASLVLNKSLVDESRASEVRVSLPKFNICLSRNNFLKKKSSEIDLNVESTEDGPPSSRQEILHTKRFYFKNKFEKKPGICKLRSPHAEMPYRSVSAHFLKDKLKENSEENTAKLAEARKKNESKSMHIKRLSEKFSFGKRGSVFSNNSKCNDTHVSKQSDWCKVSMGSGYKQLSPSRMNKMPWSKVDKKLERYIEKQNNELNVNRESWDIIPAQNQALMDQFVDFKRGEKVSKSKLRIRLNNPAQSSRQPSKPSKLFFNPN